MSSFFAHMKTKVVSILAATFFATACEATKEQSQVDQTRVMSGYIDQDFSNELLIAMREGEDLVVTSGGGAMPISVLLAYSLHNADAVVRFEDYCLSACASFLLPAVTRRELGPDLLIGVHRDLFWLRDAYLEQGGEDTDCLASFEQALDHVFQGEPRGRNFSNEVRRTLEVTGERRTYNPAGCDPIEFETTHEMWFPTSDQLRAFIDVPEGVRLCADSLDCIRAKLSSWSTDRTLIVGDTVWTRNGPVDQAD